jgi:rhodanese-related sulfurtransferase
MIFFCSLLSAENRLSDVQKNGLIIVDTHGKKVTIDRKKDLQCTNANLTPQALFGGDYAGEKISKICKKTFVTHVGVLQPMTLGKEIRTVGELELLAHIKEAQAEPSKYVLIDARTKQWFEQMTIPTSINLPFNEISYEEGKDEDDFDNEDAFEEYNEQYKRLFKILNIKETKKGLDFSKAKSVLLYCNGSWCSQSPNAIFKLVNLGYPEKKLLWYRGGLQDWLIYDFTVETPKF